MKIKTEVLFSELWEMTRKHRDQVEKYKLLPQEILEYRLDPEAWNMLECIEHLNLYGDFYLPEIERRVNESKHKPNPVFKSGLLGNYFAKSMLPSLNMKKIRTFTDKNPLNNELDKSVLDRFIEQQDKTFELLHASRRVSLSRTKTSISISNLLKLKLGDTWRVVIYHNLRHIEQANYCQRMAERNKTIKV